MSHRGQLSWGLSINALFLDNYFHNFSFGKSLPLSHWMASQTGKGEDQDRGLKERVIKEALGQKGKISPCDPKGAQLSSSSELKLAAKPDDKHCMCLNIVFTKSANSKSLGWVPHVPKGLINRAYVM